MLSKPKHICCAEANSYREKDYDQRNGVDLVHAARSHMADVDGNRVKTVRPMARARWGTHCFGRCFHLYRRTTNPKTATPTVKITNSKSAILNSRLLLMSRHTARARSNSTRSHRFPRMTLAIDCPLVIAGAHCATISLSQIGPANRKSRIMFWQTPEIAVKACYFVVDVGAEVDVAGHGMTTKPACEPPPVLLLLARDGWRWPLGLLLLTAPLIAIETNIARIAMTGAGIEWFGYAQRGHMNDFPGWRALGMGVGQLLALGLIVRGRSACR